jgi:hypothetical protein
MSAVRRVVWMILAGLGAGPFAVQGQEKAILPSVGDRWVYEARETLHPQRRYEVTVDVLAVSSDGIRDVTHSSAGDIERLHRAEPELAGIGLGNASFLPYARVFGDVRGGMRWTRLAITDLGKCSSSTFACDARARVEGSEQVTVPAGTFDAWKIVVDVSIISTLRGSATYEFWYSEKAGRFVKYRSRVRYQAITAQWTDPDMDMELVSYAPAKK